MTQNQRTGRDPLYWPCGYCYAEAGELCRRAGGEPTAAVHADRKRSVYRWQRWGQPAIDRAADVGSNTLRLSRLDELVRARQEPGV